MAEESAELVENEMPEKPALPSRISDLEPKMQVKGTVVSLELYGAFIDIGVGVNAILHISKLGERVNRVAEALSVGDEVDVWIESVDPGREQVTVTMVEPYAVDWGELKKGQVYTGTVTRLEKYGAFVDIGAEKEGLIHISELSHDYIKHPSEVVKVGDEVQAQVLDFNKRKRRIDLSRKGLLDSEDAVAEEAETDLEDEDIELPTAMEIALRRAMSQSEPSEKKASQKSGKSQASARKTREKQEDILSRTLKLNQETSDEPSPTT
jgi:small subunit ribosomal protein S1